MTEFLDRAAVIELGSVACGFPLATRDEGLLAAALARPRTSVFGLDAYPFEFDKAAALLHSLVSNHPFVDGNKRTAWAAAWGHLGMNGIWLASGFDVDAAEHLMVQVAVRGVDEWREISGMLKGFAA